MCNFGCEGGLSHAQQCRPRAFPFSTHLICAGRGGGALTSAAAVAVPPFDAAADRLCIASALLLPPRGLGLRMAAQRAAKRACEDEERERVGGVKAIPDHLTHETLKPGCARETTARKQNVLTLGQAPSRQTRRRPRPPPPTHHPDTKQRSAKRRQGCCYMRARAHQRNCAASMNGHREKGVCARARREKPRERRRPARCVDLGGKQGGGLFVCLLFPS